MKMAFVKNFSITPKYTKLKVAEVKVSHAVGSKTGDINFYSPVIAAAFAGVAKACGIKVDVIGDTLISATGDDYRIKSDGGGRIELYKVNEEAIVENLGSNKLVRETDITDPRDEMV